MYNFFSIQILEVNNHNFEHISHNRALEILRGTTHLSINVKSNLLGKSLTNQNITSLKHSVKLILK